MKMEQFKDEHFGTRLKEIRRRQGLTQKELGEQIGVSLRIISYYEIESGFPPSHLLPTLSKALKVSVDELLGIKKLPEMPKNGKLWNKFKVVEKMNDNQQKKVFDYIRLVKNS